MRIRTDPTRRLRLVVAFSAAIVTAVLGPGSAMASGPLQDPATGAATAAPSDSDNGWAGRGTGTHVPGTSAALATSQPPPSGYPINGRDVSSNDHKGGKTVSWPDQKAAGDEFAYVKATEGTTYTNEYFNQDYRGAKAAGLYVGAYAWGRPDLGDPVGQANYFVDHMQWSRDGRTLPPFLDIEWPWNDLPDCYGLNQSQMRSWISSFLSQVQNRIGVTPMIYTNVNWWNPCTGNSTAFAGYLLDIASCNSSPPSVPGWGNHWTFWQYDIKECQRGSDRDSNVFNGSLAQLAQLAGAHAGSGADVAWMQQGSGLFTFSGAGFPTIGSVDGIGAPDWAGVGDYTHDGKDDLFWYYAGDGTIHTCEANGTTFTNCTMRRGPGVGKPDWAGVGDFDGDGYRDDIAWHQGSTIYTFSGSGLAPVGSVDGPGTPTWAGVGDYTHDGKDDLFWFYPDGSIHTCESTGTTFANCTMRRGPGIGTPDWAGVGDFDGDGYRDDIAWHQGSTIYTFSGTGLATIGSVDGIGTPTWAGVGDYNHDGKDDLIWYYGADGTLHTGESTGTTFANWAMRRGPGIGTPAWAGTGTFH